jgi:hypothetical protein
METPGQASSRAPAVPDAPREDGDAPRTATGPVWRFLVEPRWLGWHLFVILSFWGMLWLGDWQFRRAMDGNGLSWAYTFEWPLFAVFGLVFWARTVRDEFKLRRGPSAAEIAAAAQAEAATGAVLPGGLAGRQQGLPANADQSPGEPEDAELASYNAYLAKLNANAKAKAKAKSHVQ